MPLKITEAKIEKKVVAYCRKHGIYCRKFTSPSNRGVPDRVLCRDGRVLFLELKSLGNEPTTLQKHEMQELTKHGATVAWADTYDKATRIIENHFGIFPEVLVNPRSLI